MQATKQMLAFVLSTLVTWSLFSIILSLLSGHPFKECMTCAGTGLVMLLFGWIPGVIVCCDLAE